MPGEKWTHDFMYFWGTMQVSVLWLHKRLGDKVSQMQVASELANEFATP